MFKIFTRKNTAVVEAPAKRQVRMYVVTAINLIAPEGHNHVEYDTYSLEAAEKHYQELRSQQRYVQVKLSVVYK